MNSLDLIELIAATRLTSGEITLTALTPDGIDRLAGVASGTIHDPNYMPFGSPWSVGSALERSERLRRWYSARLDDLSRDRWTMIFSVCVRDVVVGSTNLYAERFHERRTVSTGSWLLQDVQGNGVGTQMRKMILAFAFAHLGASAATSEAWADNWPSRRVNEKVGYLRVGEYDKDRDGGTATMVKYELSRDRWSSRVLDAREIIMNLDPRLPGALA